MEIGIEVVRPEYIRPGAIKTDKGWVRTDCVLAIYRDGSDVKVKCPGVFLFSDPVVVVDVEDRWPDDIDDRVDWFAVLLWGESGAGN